MLRRATDLPEHFFAPVSTASRHAPGRHNAQQAVQACAGRGISAALALRASSAAGQALTALAAYQWASGLLTFPAGLLRSILLASRQWKNPMAAVALSARVRRLNELALGVAREVQLVGGDGLLLYVERREYLTALHRMRAGLESARVVLAKARQRMDSERRQVPE